MTGSSSPRIVFLLAGVIGVFSAGTAIQAQDPFAQPPAADDQAVSNKGLQECSQGARADLQDQ